VTKEPLPESLTRSASPPRRLLAWCAAVAIVVGIVFLLPRPAEVVAPGEVVESGVAVLLAPEPAQGEAAQAEPVAPDAVTSEPPVASLAPAASTEPGMPAVADGSVVDGGPPLASLFGERPALIAVYPEAFVMTVDGRRFEPGDTLEGGIVLDAIEQESLRFSQDGRSFTRIAFAPDVVSSVD